MKVVGQNQISKVINMDLMDMLSEWVVEKVVHFGPGDLVKNGLSHFGFHDRTGKQYAIFHQKHFLGLIGQNDRLEWTVG